MDLCALKPFEKGDLASHTVVAPFISQKVIDECTEKEVSLNGLEGISLIAPFISKEVIRVCAEQSYHRILVSIAPFNEMEFLNDLAVARSKVFQSK
ncbi:hypothetical protein BHE18_03900 [Rossellomorea aquimaris]|jgi:hypothetical protein|uniref:Uncharacterized protein n=1 Tax=Rossellomorea aquimaris TaxID=189382 RepID=A0A1J6X0Z0_9BACI|nr:hypothetical protein BHE18_03900 [Rossellomorea aquimaris]